jgi:hypothetical protein
MSRLSPLTLLAILTVTSIAPAAQRGANADRAQRDSGPRAIVGRVVDPTGKPVPDVFVTALTPEPLAGRPFHIASARLGSLTNALGEFRLEGDLYFGEYFVVALPHNQVLDASGRPNRSGYANTFYPNAVRPADAKRIRVTAGGPAGIEITLAPARLFTVSGAVIGSTGQQIAGGRLGVGHGDGFFGVDGRTLAIRPDGTFIAPALQPGSYHLRFHESGWPPARGEIPVLSGATVLVADTDITNVRVVPIRMVSATGRLKVEPGDRSGLQLSAVRINAAPIDFDGNPGPQRPGAVNDDLTFEFRTWPGEGKIHVQLPSQDWSVKAIRLDGTDVTGKPIRFIPGTNITGLEIELGKSRSR